MSEHTREPWSVDDTSARNIIYILDSTGCQVGHIDTLASCGRTWDDCAENAHLFAGAWQLPELRVELADAKRLLNDYHYGTDRLARNVRSADDLSDALEMRAITAEHKLAAAERERERLAIELAETRKDRDMWIVTCHKLAQRCTANAERMDAFRSKLAGAERQRDELARALGAVEWVYGPSGGWIGGEGCPWCKGPREEGHTDDCEREAALADVKGPA